MIGPYCKFAAVMLFCNVASLHHHSGCVTGECVSSFDNDVPSQERSCLG